MEKTLTAVYDQHEGSYRGVMDNAVLSTYDEGGWNEICTYIKTDQGAFESWMHTHTWEVNDPVLIELGPNAQGQTTTVTVLGTWLGNFPGQPPTNPPTQPIDGAGFQWLALYNNGQDLTSFTGPGTRYRVFGERDNFPAAQSGEWELDAVSFSGVTFFSVDPQAHLTDNMTGWHLQPDVNQQVYLPITNVDAQQHTLTVAGEYESIATAGTSFRIYAPPGTERVGKAAGMLSKWVAAASSHCLYAGYRYESPLAGMQVWTTTTPSATGRQTGLNFAGQHYTLHRHYDPNLMRFTSPDPAADPWWNLASYTSNSPAAGYDPDGLAADFVTASNNRRDLEGFSEYEDATLTRWGKFLLFDYTAGGEKGQHARDTFNARAVNFATVGTLVTDEEVAIMDEYADYKGYGDISDRSADAFETTKTLSYFVPGPTGSVAFGLDISNRISDGEGLEATDALVLAGRLPGLRRTGKATGEVCFVAGTQVLVDSASGERTSKAIEEVHIGDQVWSRDESSGEEGFKPVVTLFRTHPTELIHLSYLREPKSGEADPDRVLTLIGTATHPLWSLSRNDWVPMGGLKPGERLLLADNTQAVVSRHWVETLQNTTNQAAKACGHFETYNFEVADWHTYYAAPESAPSIADAAWVHNKGGPCKGFRTSKEAEKYVAKVKGGERAGKGSGILTKLGWRKPDVTVASKKRIIEVKIGKVKYSRFIRKQIAKDYLALKNGLRSSNGMQVQQVTWYFFKNRKGVVKVDPRVIAQLKKAGIRYKIVGKGG